MTIFTRPSRLAQRNAYLVAKHGDNIEAIVEELQDHAVRLPFDVKTADFDLMLKRFEFFQSISSAVAYKFPYQWRSHLPNLSGQPVAFIPADYHVEVILKTRQGYGANATNAYRAVRLHESLFSGRTDVVAMWTRKTLRAAMQAQREAEAQKLTEQAKEARAQRERLDRDIESAERTLTAIADARTRRAERKARSHAARAEYAARNAQ